jgi:xanthine dehydrogenase YagR molybdenum-binding subunit
MYACPNIASNVTIVRADRATPGFMRAPAETPYFFALESAMDELAVALKMDPIELRRVNDTQTEPIKGLPYTSRALMTCFDQAAEAFDWKARNPAPGTKRDGDWLVGWLGMRRLRLSDPDGGRDSPGPRLCGRARAG